MLIHIDAEHGPLGVWTISDTGHLDSMYQAPAVGRGPAEVIGRARDRARTALGAKADHIPWDAWFEQLAETTGHLDNYDLYDAAPLEDPRITLARYRSPS